MNDKFRNAKQILTLWRNGVRERYVAKAMEIAEHENRSGSRAPDELYRQLDGLKTDLEQAGAAIEYVPDI